MKHEFVNAEICRLIGWTDIRNPNRGPYGGHWIGMMPGANMPMILPNHFYNLNAVTDVLKEYDARFVIDFGPTYSVTIIPEGRANEPDPPKFKADNVDWYAEYGEHPTIQELAGTALLEFLSWWKSL